MPTSLTGQPPSSEVAVPSAAAKLDATLLLELERTAIRYVSQAGVVARDRFRKPLTISQKGARRGEDVVSDVDYSIQQMIGENLSRDFPQHTLLGEENLPQMSASASDLVWAVDPIDGTKNFVNGATEFGVSVGVLYRGQPVAGAIWTPWPQGGSRIAHARLGGGAYMNKTKVVLEGRDSMPQRGRLSLLPGNFWYTFKVQPAFLNNLFDVRVVGCAVWEMLMLGEGNAQFFVSAYCRIWDLVAAVLFIKEAGGVVLTGTAESGWSHLNSFVEQQHYANDEQTYARLRAWKQPIFACATGLEEFMRTNMAPSTTTGETPTSSPPYRTPPGVSS